MSGTFSTANTNLKKVFIMKQLRIIVIIFIFAFTAFMQNFLQAQTINFRFSTYFYSWQRLDSLTSTIGATPTYTTHLRGYQNLMFDVNYKKWTFTTFTQVDEDVTNRAGKGFNYRLYNMMIKGNNLFDALDIKLGRQYISAGSGKGTIDGLYLKLKLGKNKEYQFIGYGGYLSPLSYEFEKYLQLKENFLAGGQFLYYGVKDLTLGLSYANKNRKNPDYYALRPDSLFNTRTVLIETDSKADQIAGIDANYRLMKKHNLYGRGYFDVNRTKFIRGEFNGNFELTKNLRLSAGYTYREPQISYNSMFWVFEHKKYQELEGGLDYITKFLGSDINLSGRVADVLYDGDHSLKIQLGVGNSIFGLSFTKYTGYTGEAEGIYGYINQELIKTKLTFSANLNYTGYKLGKYDDSRSTALGGILGLTWRPDPRISIDGQGQVLVNDVYKYDTRFLIGFNYWLFSKL